MMVNGVAEGVDEGEVAVGVGMGVAVGVMVMGVEVGMEVEKTGVISGVGVDWHAVKIITHSKRAFS